MSIRKSRRLGGTCTSVGEPMYWSSTSGDEFEWSMSGIDSKAWSRIWSRVTGRNSSMSFSRGLIRSRIGKHGQ